MNACYIQFVSQPSQVILGMYWAQMMFFNIYTGVTSTAECQFPNLS